MGELFRGLLVLPITMSCSNRTPPTSVTGALAVWSCAVLFVLVIPQAAVSQELGANRHDPQSWTWGSARAPVEIIEFTDFGCGFCAQFHAETYATLFTEYVETGKVRWIFVPFASGKFRGSFEATRFVACAAEQGRALPTVRALVFERQSQWSTGDAERHVRGYAEELGLAMDTYDACFASQEVRNRIRENGLRAIEAGVRGTPTLFIQGFPVMGALPVFSYRAIIDRAVDRVRGPGVSGAGASR